MSALDRLTRHQHEGLVLDAEETREVLACIAGLQKDAARYRWLRDDSIDYPYGETKSSPWCVYGPNSGAIQSRPIEGRELDEAVDAAIAKATGQ